MIQSNPQVNLLTRLMDVASLRSEVIANNVANVNTPGYQCLDVQFECELTRALASGRPTTAQELAPTVVPGGGGTVRADGNDVDIDRQMGALQKNNLLFELYAQLLSVQIAQHRSAIQGR
jgi:flagellar basal-body rod protein FlgB